MPPGFVPPGLAKKCGQTDEEYPDMHPGGPRDGWEKQQKKKHWELYYTNDVSLALPEPLQVTEADSTKWKQSHVYGAGGERLSMTYLPAYDANNGWEQTPGEGGAEPGTQPKTLWYLQDALGSTIGLEEKDGRVSARYHYDEFGVMLDSKKSDLNWPGPDSLFGYTGLGYDYSSGLTYARARYYQPELGRFISEDTYKGTLGNPQSQNLYTYVHNNPLIYTDPSGHKIWLIHGTNLKKRKDPEVTWTSDFIEYIGDLYNEDVATPRWSGGKTGNNNSARKSAAEIIADEIITWRKENPDEPIRLVGHSHGGNVAIMIANLLGDESIKVETLVTIATPVRGYKLKQDVGQHLHVYNERDGIQINGGSIWLLGSALRTFNNAANVKVEVDEKYDGLESHSVMHSNVVSGKSIFNQI